MATTIPGSTYFENGPDAFALAKRMARYGHRDWIVWRPAGMAGRKAAKLTQGSLEEAIADVGETGTFTAIQKNDGVGINVRGWLAQTWLKNMRAGTFAY